jgi:hypothetical protein
MTDFDQALERAQQWLDDEGVDAVGEGDAAGRRVIDVWVRRAELSLEIPSELDGVPVRLRDSGGGIDALQPG